MALNSPYPPAAVARVPAPDGGGAVSGVLVPRHMGYLTIKVLFHGQPQAGLEVKFFATTPDGQKGDAVGEAVTTDAQGVAGADRLVAAGVYLCEIKDQPPTEVPTVNDAGLRAPVVLPIGRPFIDLFEGPEFVAADADADDQADDGGAGA